MAPYVLTVAFFFCLCAASGPLQNKYSGACLTTEGGFRYTSNCVHFSQYQLWTFVADPNNAEFFQIRNSQTGKCIVNRGGKNYVGQPDNWYFQTIGCTHYRDCYWRKYLDQGDYFMIKNVHTGLCLFQKNTIFGVQGCTYYDDMKWRHTYDYHREVEGNLITDPDYSRNVLTFHWKPTFKSDKVIFTEPCNLHKNWLVHYEKVIQLGPCDWYHRDNWDYFMSANDMPKINYQNFGHIFYAPIEFCIYKSCLPKGTGSAAQKVGEHEIGRGEDGESEIAYGIMVYCIACLLVVNVVCLMVYCYRQMSGRKKMGYKPVQFQSETETEC